MESKQQVEPQHLGKAPRSATAAPETPPAAAQAMSLSLHKLNVKDQERENHRKLIVRAKQWTYISCSALVILVCLIPVFLYSLGNDYYPSSLVRANLFIIAILSILIAIIAVAQRFKIIEYLFCVIATGFILTWDIVQLVKAIPPTEMTNDRHIISIVACAVLVIALPRQASVYSMVGFMLCHLGLHWVHLMRYPWGKQHSYQLDDSVFALLAATLIGYTTVYQFALQKSREHSNQLQAVANTDQLTSVANRHYITTVMDSLHGYCVILASLDRFKKINDEHGHQFGDNIVQEVARTLASAFQDTGIVSRWGGDEFLIVVPDKSAEQALLPLATARNQLENLIPGTVLTITSGIATCQVGEPTDDVLTRAEKLTAHGKKSGRNRIFTDSMADALAEAMSQPDPSETAS